MNTEEQKYYNASNIALRSNYEHLKKRFEEKKSWRAAWNKLRHETKVNPEEEWARLEGAGVTLTLNTAKNFPAQLKEIPWLPFGLYAKGAPLTKTENSIAIVGTRKATQSGKEIAKHFGKNLGALGLTVVSGLALGIDASAQESAVKAGGKTIGVLANGLDSIYPKQNEALAKEILANHGSLISEYPLGTPSLPKNFIERNRIVSGLSLGVIIIEAPKRSGTLATARFALEQNREIFVVPGQITNKNYEGSHDLIKSGASLITATDDVVTALNLESVVDKMSSAILAKTSAKLDGKQKIIINLLMSLGEKVSADGIAARTAIKTPEVTSALSLLIIQGLIKEENGKYSI